MGTDLEWEKWGQTDPYFGVITEEKFRSKNLTDQARSDFFESGQAAIQQILQLCQRHFVSDFRPKQALEFGCGVGRLLIPLAAIAEQVVGLDVSESMLQEAQRNCDRDSLKNVRLLRSDDELSQLEELENKFDFIYSFIVFQHIPVQRGQKIFRRLLSYLESGGVGAIQITYSKSVFETTNGIDPIFKRALRPLKSWLSKGFQQGPSMQMNTYALNSLFFILQSEGVQRMHVEFTNHGGELGVILLFQKPNSAESIAARSCL